MNIGGVLSDVHTYRTTDGGASWTETGALKGEPHVDHVAFSSPNDGWATASLFVWRTSDGGVTWQKARSDPYGGKIDVRGQDIWIVGTSGAIRSTDGGATWTNGKVSGSVVSFADSADGWVAQGATYRHTTDGGAAWTRLTPGTPRQIGSLSAVPGGVVWGVAGPVVTTADGGVHWRLAGRRTVNAVSANQRLAGVGGRRQRRDRPHHRRRSSLEREGQPCEYHSGERRLQRCQSRLGRWRRRGDPAHQRRRAPLALHA